MPDNDEIFDPTNDLDNQGPAILEALGFEGEFGVWGDTLICSHGYEIEMDGNCPEGCTGIL